MNVHGRPKGNTVKIIFLDQQRIASIRRQILLLQLSLFLPLPHAVPQPGIAAPLMQQP
jgi:hypothetical protein